MRKYLQFGCVLAGICALPAFGQVDHLQVIVDKVPAVGTGNNLLAALG